MLIQCSIYLVMCACVLLEVGVPLGSVLDLLHFFLYIKKVIHFKKKTANIILIPDSLVYIPKEVIYFN